MVSHEWWDLKVHAVVGIAKGSWDVLFLIFSCKTRKYIGQTLLVLEWDPLLADRGDSWGFPSVWKFHLTDATCMVEDVSQSCGYCRPICVVLCIVYFKRYDRYHDRHEVIFNMYQQYILSGFIPKNLIYPPISWEFGYFNDQIWAKMYRLKYCVTKMNHTICII